jgi:hypothetical protein
LQIVTGVKFQKVIEERRRVSSLRSRTGTGYIAKRYFIMLTRFIFRQIWDLSEYTGIGLGKFAPFVFSMMIGRKGNKKE